ncbi:hypothetical protein BGZ54_006427 [Gamsiella multidivaricata]|nr:hypothetical protein BGZ54_006427 [Gamsiella multidivaricata]
MSDLNDAFDRHQKIVLDFFVENDPECQRMDSYFEKVATDSAHKGIAFLRINVNEIKDVQDRYDIKTVPTFLSIHSRELMGQCQGTTPEKLDRLVMDLSMV